MSKDRDEFIAVLVREFPDKSIAGIIDFASKLMRWGRQYGRIQEDQCNRELTESEKRMENRLEVRIAALCVDAGLQAKLGGDPRGYTVKVILPSGRYNTWGGAEDGWGVPNS